MPTVIDQIHLEHEMVLEGVRRYQHGQNKMIEKGMESQTAEGRAIMASVVTKGAEGIEHVESTNTDTLEWIHKFHDATAT